MKKSFCLFAAALVSACLISQSAQAGFISVLAGKSGSAGILYKVDTATGVLQTEVASLNSSVNSSTSPNALGYDAGSYVYSTYDSSNPQTIYTSFGTQFNVSPDGSSIASGDLYQNTYVYSTSNGKLSVINNVFAKSGNVTPDATYNAIAGNLGDLALQRSGTDLVGYVSHDTGALTSFKISGGVLSNVLTYTDGGNKFLGLAYSNGVLFGVRGLNSGYGIYSINVTGPGVFTSTLTSAITGLATGYALTDASSFGSQGNPAVPEPATLAIFGCGLAGFGFRRARKAFARKS